MTRRTVAVLGPPGAGKTALVAALAGRSAAPGPTTGLALTVVRVGDASLQLLDTPGEPDLVVGRVAALRAADAVVVVVSSPAGLDPWTVDLWGRLALAELPRVVVVTHLDAPRADFEETALVLARVLGDDVLARHLPLHDDDGRVGGLLDLLTLQVADHSSGERVLRPADPEHAALVEAVRGDLVEAVLTGSAEESLLDDYLTGDEPGGDVLAAEHAAAVAAGSLSPVHAVCGPVGVTELLELLAGLPARPAPVVTSPDGSPAVLDGLCAEVLAPGLVHVVAGQLGDLVAGAVGPAPGGPVGATLGGLLLSPWDLPEPLLPLPLPHDADALVAADPSLAVRDGLLWVQGPAHAARHGLDAGPAPADPAATSALVVRVPGWAAGTVRTDLARRGASDVRTTADGDDDVTITAIVRDEEIRDYALVLRRLTHGTGTATRTRRP